MKYVIGVDIGGTFIKAGVVSEKGDILAISQIPTKSEREFCDVMSDIANLCLRITESAGVNFSEICAIGADMPGFVNSESGVVVSGCNLGWKKQNVAEELFRLTKKPTYVLNDGKAAIYGEYKFGKYKFRSAALITLGTGVGGGIIQDGKLSPAMSNELGHTVIKANGKKCNCGRKGCLETYASATALINSAKKAAKRYPNSELLKSDIDGKSVFAAYKNGDFAAKKVVDAYIEYLAEGVANILFSLMPELVLIGGGVSLAGDALFEPLKKAVDSKVCGVALPEFEIKPTTLGNHAGLCGAAAFALDNLGGVQNNE